MLNAEIGFVKWCACLWRIVSFEKIESAAVESKVVMGCCYILWRVDDRDVLKAQTRIHMERVTRC